MAQTHAALGTALSKLGQADNAIGEFKLALQLDPTFIPAAGWTGASSYRAEKVLSCYRLSEGFTGR